MNHKHKVIEIVKWHSCNHFYVYWVVMDCPVNPSKIIVTVSPIKRNQVLDPHFTNHYIKGGFPANESGWNDAHNMVDMKGLNQY